MIVPFAACSAGSCAEALPGLQLPHLQRLLARLGPAATDATGPDSLTPPHERALARACGLEAPDGLAPLAAWEALQAGRDPAGEAWAWITPCHWRVATDHIQMAHACDLQLDGEDSQALLALMQPYFAGDGIVLEYEAPMRWLARGEIFRTLPTASLDRVAGRTVDPWLPRMEAARPLRRLQQEMQMLLYTLPLNEERQRGGLLPVNSFWVSGTGALPANHAARRPAGLQVTPYLRDAALQDNGAAWAKAWQEFDERECARLLGELERGRSVQLTLCGESAARTWSSADGSLLRRLGALLSRPSPAALLGALQ